MQAGTDMVVLDSRPFDEFHRVSIPTGVDVLNQREDLSPTTRSDFVAQNLQLLQVDHPAIVQDDVGKIPDVDNLLVAPALRGIVIGKPQSRSKRAMIGASGLFLRYGKPK